MDALKKTDISIPFYFRYVDDIIMTVPSSEIDKVLTNFNTWHPKLQFTMEVDGNRINVLDLTIIINEKRMLEFNWFHKPTFSGRYLNYLSTHPSSQKKGVIMGMLDSSITFKSEIS